MRVQSRIQTWATLFALLVMILAASRSPALLGARGMAEGVSNKAKPRPQAQEPPLVTYVQLKGKKLIVKGSNFDDGAVIRVDGIALTTESGADDAASMLIARKAGKRIQRETIARLQVQNRDGRLSEELSFYTGCNSQ